MAGGLVKDPGVNAGRVFYEDERLNVILARCSRATGSGTSTVSATEDFTPRQQGSRTKAEEHKWPLAAAPGVQLHSASDGVRNDWVEIDRAAVAVAAVGCGEDAGGSGACGSTRIRRRTRGDDSPVRTSSNA